MKNLNKKIIMFLCAGIIVQTSSSLWGMGRVKKAAQTTASTVRSQISGRWQAVRDNLGKLQDAVSCMNTNSCNAQQQAFIKSAFKKLAVAVAAAAAACGIYATVRSRQYETVKEDVDVVNNIAKGFNLTGANTIHFLIGVKEFADAVRQKNPAANEMLNKLKEQENIVGDNEPSNVKDAVMKLLERYAKTSFATELPVLARNLVSYIDAIIRVSGERYSESE